MPNDLARALKPSAIGMVLAIFAMDVPEALHFSYLPHTLGMLVFLFCNVNGCLARVLVIILFFFRILHYLPLPLDDAVHVDPCLLELDAWLHTPHHSICFLLLHEFADFS